MRNTGFVWGACARKYLGVGGVLRDGLGALGDGVLGELAGEDEADGRLTDAAIARKPRLLAQRPSRRRGAQSQGIKVELPIVPSPLRSPFRDQLRRLAAPLAIP